MSNYSFGRGRRENSRSNNSLGDYVNTNNNSGRNSDFSDSRRNERRGDRRETGSLRRGGNSGGLNGSERGIRRNISYQRLPREEGMIVSLLESFGFIKCAQREEDVFFHYSEMDRNSFHPSELEIGMEVNFDIGPSSQGTNRGSNSDKEKLAAFRVNVLPKGTVKWELPDEDNILKKQGIVENAARVQHSRSTDIRTSPYDGTICLIIESEDNENDDDKEGNAKNEGSKRSNESVMIPYSVDDYDPERNQPSRLSKGDLVEFETVIERRTNKKLAKNIRLIQSERDRQRELKEKKMLAEASLEQGVVVSLSDKDGFLRSSSRREHIYFQYTYIELPDKDPDSNLNNEYTLAVGQDMEFLVCKETANGRNQHVNRFVARKIKFLPKDTVQFYQTVSTGAIGSVCTLPIPANPNRRRANIVEKKGKIRLKNPISFEDSVVTEVILDVNEVPGGTYAANRDGSQVGLWIREGDVLLFDVIKETLDGSFHAKPTQYLLPANEADTSELNLNERKDIRLLEPSRTGRFQGTVSALKEGYGFVTCAERAVDIYFRLYEIFPTSLQTDIMRYSSKDSNCSDAQKLMVGSKVTFDIYLTNAGSHDYSRGRHSKSHNLENMKAQRICIEPNDSFAVDILISENVRAIVKQVHKDKSGYFELDNPVTAMSHDERHPIVSALLNAIKVDGETVVYPMSLGVNEAQVVMSMAEQKGLHVEFVGGSKDAVSPDPLINGYAKMKISNLTFDDARNFEDSESNRANSPIQEEENNNVSFVVPSPTDEITNNNKNSAKKRSVRKVKPVKTIRFERSSIASDNNGGAPDVGDVVECNVTQSRKTGAYLATNVKVIERKMVERNVGDGNESHLKPLNIAGSGLVTEILLKRDFGFITQIDDNGLKKEVLFFHMSSVVAKDCTDQPLQDSPEKQTRKHRGRQHDHGLIRKGDEVKFDIGKNEKNGKRIAMNIVVLPNGTLQIPSKAEKNACTGMILMEPSHTSLSNTPAHASSLSANTTKSPGGRWSDINESKKKKESGSHMSELGVILLLSDPHSHVNKSTKMDKISDIENVSTKVSKITVEQKTPSAQNEEEPEDPILPGNSENDSHPTHYDHVIYRSVGIAVRGVGSSSSVDTGGAPRRGDLVSFAKGKGSNTTAKDVRIISRNSATTRLGYLLNISVEEFTATFVAANDKTEKYEISLKEVISCDPKLLNERSKVEGILHEGKIYGGKNKF